MIFGNFITYGVLPFILMFVLVFAVLQKSKILGDGKHQIDALVSLTLALMLVAVPGPQRDIIIHLMPWLAVALAVLLVFFILYGFVAGDLSNLSNGWKIGFGLLAGVFTISLVVYLTNLDRIIASWASGSGDWLVNGIILILVVGGIVWVVREGKEK
jgi:hypothetical protein